MIILNSLIFLLIFTGIIYFVDVIRTNYVIENLFMSFLFSEKNKKQISETFFNSLLLELSHLFHSSFSSYYKYKDKNIQMSFFKTIDKKWKEKYFNKNEIFIDMNNKKELLSRNLTLSLKEEMFFSEKKHDFLFRHYLIFPILKNENQLDSFYLFVFRNSFSLMRAKKIFFLTNHKLQEILLNIHLVIRSQEHSMISNILNMIRDYAFLILDKNQLITSWNLGAQYIFGYNKKEIVNQSFYKLILKEDFKQIKKMFENAQKEESAFKVKMIGSNKTIISCELQIKKVEIEEVFSGYTVLIKDITKNEVLIENLKKKTLINRSIVENNRDGIILLDERDRIIYANEKITKILKTSMNITGMDLNFVFSSKDIKEIKSKIKEIKTLPIEGNYTDIKIDKFWYNIRFFKIKKDINILIKEKYNGVILFFIDNTNRIKTRLELEKNKKELENFNKQLLQDIESAGVLQKSLIPKKELKTRQILTESIFYLSDQLGGDFYYYEELIIKRKKYYPILITDVSGHGVAASMLSVLVKDIYNEFKENAEKTENVQPKNFILLLNQKINQLQMEGSQFITVFFALFDLDLKEVTYSSAGHPSMVQIKRNEIKFLDIKNSPPTGLFENQKYTQEKASISKGDRFLIYSDGILDVFSSKDSYLGGFKEFLSSQIQNNIIKIKNNIENEIDIAPADSKKDKDDITLVAVEIR